MNILKNYFFGTYGNRKTEKLHVYFFKKNNIKWKGLYQALARKG